MTPKEKAKELLSLCDLDTGLMTSERKECSVLIVDGIINELKEWGAPNIFEESTQNDWANNRMNFWEEVKKEICVS